MAKKYSLKAEVFAVGQWNGMEFTREDLNSIAAAFSKLGDNHRVPLKFGHNDDQKYTDGQPALGWVTNVWVEGDKLFAQLDDMPEVVFTAMEAKLYRNVSIELDMGVEHKGDYYPWVLSGVALLGADIPAVNTLADLTTYMERDQLSFKKRVVFTTTHGNKPVKKETNMSSAEDRELINALQATKEAQAIQMAQQAEEIVLLKRQIADNSAQFKAVEAANEVRKVAEERKELFTMLEGMVTEKQILPAMREEFMRDYDEAATEDDRKVAIRAAKKLQTTIQGNVNYFGAESARRKSEIERQEAELDAGEIVTRRTREFMAKNGTDDFSAAKRAVLSADVELANRYVKKEA